eukprot:365497-Chlamydomonas_euryale.AAC.1
MEMRHTAWHAHASQHGDVARGLGRGAGLGMRMRHMHQSMVTWHEHGDEAHGLACACDTYIATWGRGMEVKCKAWHVHVKQMAKFSARLGDQ